MLGSKRRERKEVLELIQKLPGVMEETERLPGVKEMLPTGSADRMSKIFPKRIVQMTDNVLGDNAAHSLFVLAQIDDILKTATRHMPDELAAVPRELYRSATTAGLLTTMSKLTTTEKLYDPTTPLTELRNMATYFARARPKEIVRFCEDSEAGLPKVLRDVMIDAHEIRTNGIIVSEDKEKMEKRAFSPGEKAKIELPHRYAHEREEPIRIHEGDGLDLAEKKKKRRIRQIDNERQLIAEDEPVVTLDVMLRKDDSFMVTLDKKGKPLQLVDELIRRHTLKQALTNLRSSRI